MLEHIRIGQIGNSMLRYTEGGGQATKCVYLSICGSARDVGLGVGRGLQSTVNDAGAHHLDNGSQHGVLALKKLSFSSVFFKGFSGGYDVPPITLIPILFNALHVLFLL